MNENKRYYTMLLVTMTLGLLLLGVALTQITSAQTTFTTKDYDSTTYTVDWIWCKNLECTTDIVDIEIEWGYIGNNRFPEEVYVHSNLPGFEGECIYDHDENEYNGRIRFYAGGLHHYNIACHGVKFETTTLKAPSGIHLAPKIYCITLYMHTSDNTGDSYTAETIYQSCH